MSSVLGASVFQAPVKPVFVAEAKATDPVLGGGSLCVRPEGPVSGSSAACTNPSLLQNTQRARATGKGWPTTTTCTVMLSLCHHDLQPCSIIRGSYKFPPV